MKAMARTATVAELASALGCRQEESSIVAELKAGNEDAYAWLVTHFHQPVYSLVLRMVSDPADAADTTQDVFLKVFRGIQRFQGNSSLKTWIYRIAVHEASNRKRWWCRHKGRETSLEPLHSESEGAAALGLKDVLVDGSESPFDYTAHEEVRARVERELAQVPEPFRTTVVLRDIEDLSYEEIAEVMQVSLGTVKSRLTRGRDALRKRLEPFVREAGEAMDLHAVNPTSKKEASKLEVEQTQRVAIEVTS